MNKLVIIVFCMFNTIAITANNLKIANLEFIPDNSELGYAHIQFDMSWENSWRDIENWDAIWVFIKYNDGKG